ncbi:hypothetical protein LPB142_16795 (plasmid) [Rhodobacter xanthinilyticus]|uniref:Uncharacterized protein n=1 Tax=Rhodobacter xanthinilyticus TaxID=1850250 RepID=A0A1D9MHP9_9RHOB|nr:hypothetical protein LPB142_16795 [Rhodobacter xanthinilyticus]
MRAVVLAGQGSVRGATGGDRIGWLDQTVQAKKLAGVTKALLVINLLEPITAFMIVPLDEHGSLAMSGAKTPQEALDALCADQERVLERLERAGIQGDIGPKLNEEMDAQYWFDQPGAPYPKLENEDETPQTVSYDELIKSWQ